MPRSIYISRDVAFDEIVFPFVNLHPNARSHLRKEILLLPEHLLNPGGVTYADKSPANAHPLPSIECAPHEHGASPVASTRNWEIHVAPDAQDPSPGSHTDTPVAAAPEQL